MSETLVAAPLRKVRLIRVEARIISLRGQLGGLIKNFSTLAIKERNGLV